jgi:hypothetical protein
MLRMRSGFVRAGASMLVKLERTESVAEAEQNRGLDTLLNATAI